jgi:Spy/CpxP family protein refolding chaperone
MKTNEFLILAMAAVVIAGGLTSPKTLAADGSTSRPVRGQFLQRLAERLNLTDEQRAQIKVVLSGEKDTLKALLNQLHDARKNLRTAIQAGDATEASVRVASARVAALEADLAVERMKLYGKIAPILTEAQRQQIADFRRRADDIADNAIGRLGERLGD